MIQHSTEERKIMRGRKKRKEMKNPSPPTMEDRISELPDEIIHQILQSLGSHKQAARTSILSRRWLHLWLSYPVVEYRLFNGKSIDSLESFVVATSRRLLHERSIPLLLDSLNIFQWFPNISQPLYQLMSTALVWFDGGGGSRSPLKVVLTNHYNPNFTGLLEGGKLLNCSRTKFLQLRGFDLTGLQKPLLDNLQELSLDDVRLSEKIFPNCLTNARHLEKLSLGFIIGIQSLDISVSNFPSLISLSFNGILPNRLKQLKISSAPLLRSFCFIGYCKLLTVVSAPNVKIVGLELKDELISSREVEDLISKFPSLESLDFNLSAVRVNDGVRISTHSLLKLTLTQSELKSEFEIDAPNLITLSIKTNALPNNFRVVNVAPSCQCVVDCSCYQGSLPTSWFIDLSKCLKALATPFHQLVFKLHFRLLPKVSTLDLSQVECESSPLVVQHLQLGTDLPLGPKDIGKRDNKTLLLDGLLSTLHPMTLSIARLPHSHYKKSLFSDVLKIGEHMSKKMKKPSPTVDRISELPEEIIHLILLSLNSYKLAARTSILSRRWFRFWSSYPVVDGFERGWFDTFAESTSRRLLHERQVPLLLDSFTIILNRVYNSQYLNQLLSSASLLSPADDDEAYGNRSPLKVVFIHTFTNGKFYPGRMLLNCRRTKFLHLQNCDLTQFCGFKNSSHYNLLELNLQHVRVTEQIFLMFMANAPRLEKLSLRSVHGVRSFDICASGFPCLKSLSFDGEHRYEKMIPDMELQLTSAPLLQTLTFLSGKGNFSLQKKT
ncbi:hypothetical protein LINPERHAP2_LOCUS18547 [Linum perenne]